MASIAIKGHEFDKVSQSSIRAKIKSSICLREVRMILDKNIVHRYLNAKRKLTESNVEKIKKQMKLTDYFKKDKILDCNSPNRNGTVTAPSNGYSNNIFHDNDRQMPNSTENKENSNYTNKTEPSETADETCMDEYCYDNLDIGAEFKFSDFLSRSISPHVDVPNEQTVEETHAKKKLKSTPKSWAERKKYFQCDHCGYKTTQKSFLPSHIRTKHSQLHDENGFITCAKCSTKFTTLYRYKAHKLICGTKLYMYCKFCRKKFRLVDQLKKHVINHHPKEIRNEKELNEILQWCKSRQVRMATIRRKGKMPNSESLKHLNYSLKQLISIFCSKCNVISEMTAGKRMIQCLTCETKLLLQCKKCKKTFDNIPPTFSHIRRLCETTEDDFIIDKNNKALKIVEEQQSNNSIDMCNSLQEDVQAQPLPIKSEIFMNENQDFRLDDLNEQSKFVEFSSNSENAPTNVHEKEKQGIDVNKKLEHTRTSSKEAVPTPKIKPFECNHCGHRTKKKSLLERHIKYKHSQLHDENGIITCAKCDKKYKTLAKFNSHKNICGTKFYFPCKFCSKLFAASEAAKRHIFSQHQEEFDAEKLYEIVEWSKSKAVRKTSNLGRSLNAHVPRKKRLFRSYFDLNKLIKMFCSKCNVTSERELGKTKIQCLKCDTALTFQCQMCKKTYDKSASLRTHMEWYCKGREGNFNMNINEAASDGIIKKEPSNNSTFDNLYIAPLPKGSYLKTKVGYFYCNDCDYQSDKKHKLLHHIRFNHVKSSDREDSVICPKCQRKFKRSKNCRAHQLVCSATFNYKCTFCKYFGKQSLHVKRHIISKHADKIKGKKLDHIVNEIMKDRKKIKEKYEAAKLKKLLIANEDLSECFDLHKVIKMICPKCHVVSDRLKYQIVKHCSKCEKFLEYQCQRCGQSFDKYESTWRHVKISCRLIRKK